MYISIHDIFQSFFVLCNILGINTQERIVIEKRKQVSEEKVMKFSVKLVSSYTQQHDFVFDILDL